MTAGTGTSKNLAIPAGQTSATFTLAATADGSTEGSETVVYQLEVGEDPYRIDAANLEATVTITDVPAGMNASLSALTATSAASATGTFAALALTPSTFASGTLQYTASVTSDTHVKITPTVERQRRDGAGGRGVEPEHGHERLGERRDRAGGGRDRDQG